MPDNLEEVKTAADEVAPVEIEAETPNEETELSDEDLLAEIERLDELAKKEEDPKEKRHLEQQKGWSQKIAKEREKAKAIAEQNARALEAKEKYESSLVEEVYSKIIDDNFGLPYLEKLMVTHPDIAERVAKERWGTSAKKLVLETKRSMAGENEDIRNQVTEEDIRAKVLHEVAMEDARAEFEELDASEKAQAEEYFAEMSEGKTLTRQKAKQFAEMARIYATRNRKPEPKHIDKDRILAEKASTGISPKSGTVAAPATDNSAIRRQLLDAGLSIHQVNAMYPLN